MLAALAASVALACAGEPTPLARVDARELLSMRDLAGVSVSPDRQQIAFQVQQADPDTNAYSSSWCVIGVQGGAARRIGDGGDIAMPQLGGLGRRSGVWLTLAARWSPDSRQIAFIATQNGETQIRVCRASQNACRTAVQGDGEIVDLVWTPGGSAIVYQTRRRDAETEARAHEALRGFHFDDRFDIWHQSIPVRMREGDASIIRTYDIRQRRSRDADASERDAFAARRPSPATYSLGASRSLTASALAPVPPPPLPDGRDARSILRLGESGAVWTEPADSTRAGMAPPLRLHARARDDAAAVACLPESCTGAIIEFAPAGPDQILFLRREGWARSETGVYLWSLRTGDVRQLTNTTDVIRACTPLAAYAICQHEGPTRPRTLITVQYDTGAVSTLFDPNPGYTRAAFINARRLQWRAPDGSELFGWLVTPERNDGERLPLVVVQYRASGFLRGGVGDEHPIQAFARRGFAVLVLERPDPFDLMAAIRDPDEFERREWSDLAERRRTLAALTSGISEVVRLGVADPDRIGVTGLSDGAETALFAAIHCSCARAFAVSNGFHDPFSYYFSSERSRASMRDQGLGDLFAADAPLWRDLSPALNASRIRTPILVQIPDRELSFALQSSRAFADAGAPFDLYVFPDEYHVKWQPAHRRAVYHRSLAWFQFWLQNTESELASPGELARWRAWRDAFTPSGGF